MSVTCSKANSLPLELWQFILQFLPPGDLFKLSAVSRTFNESVVRELYRHVELVNSTLRQVLSWATRMAGAPTSAQMTRSLSLPTQMPLRNYSMGDLNRLTEQAPQAMRALVNLKSLYILPPSRKDHHAYSIGIHSFLGCQFRLHTFRYIWHGMRAPETLLSFIKEQNDIRDLKIGKLLAIPEDAGSALANILPRLSVASISYEPPVLFKVIAARPLTRLQLEIPKTGFEDAVRLLASASETLTHLHVYFQSVPFMTEARHTAMLQRIAESLPKLQFLRYPYIRTLASELSPWEWRTFPSELASFKHLETLHLAFSARNREHVVGGPELYARGLVARYIVHQGVGEFGSGGWQHSADGKIGLEGRVVVRGKIFNKNESVVLVPSKLDRSPSLQSARAVILTCTITPFCCIVTTYHFQQPLNRFGGNKSSLKVLTLVPASGQGSSSKLMVSRAVILEQRLSDSQLDCVLLVFIRTNADRAKNGVTSDSRGSCAPGPRLTNLLASSIYLAPVVSAAAISGLTGHAKPNYWFSLETSGDSYTATGFSSNGTLPTPGNPLGNPAYPGITGAGGSNWVDVDTTIYNKSLILTYNYAYSGATIDAALVTPYIPIVASLKDQVEDFLATAAAKPASTPWTSEDSLFSIWIGINDIGNSYYWTNGSRSAFSELLLDTEFALVEKLILATTVHNQTLERSVIDDFNQKLAAKVAVFELEHPAAKIYLWDSHAVFTTILDDLPKYGFVNNATAFGETGDFWGLER
ncbi:hypothetical protein HWV62_37885 [Athelia sp. TMB]|nr:hypothetical protein HWV62_37885 [Athelia sp. TMB]